MTNIIKFINVSKSYNVGGKEFLAVNNVNFEINEGEFVVIIGPSGAGKSTVLNLLGGMDTASSGNILFQNEDITKYSDNKLTKYRASNIGFVFQFYNLIPSLTAYENVALIKDIEKNALDPKVVLESVGLSEHINQFPSQMSGGEQQRVSIARAICKNPKILLCDEPTGALDTVTGREVMITLQNMSKNHGQTVIIVTHNNSFTGIADKVIKIKNGKIEDIIVNEKPIDAVEVIL